MAFDIFFKKASKSNLSQGKNLMPYVRELEALSPNEMSAFVDDGPDSFDVLVSFDPTNNSISSVTCDCEDTKDICPHKVAVLMTIKLGQKGAGDALLVKKVKRKKLSPIEELFDTVDTMQIRNWLLGELTINKELALKFSSDFSEKSLDINAVAIKSQTGIILKAIIGTKKRIELTQLKPIFDLWTKYIEANINAITLSLENNKGAENYLAIYNFYVEVDDRLSSSSTRIATHRGKTFDYINAFISTNNKIDLQNFFERITTIVKKSITTNTINWLIDIYMQLSSNMNSGQRITSISALSSIKNVFEHSTENKLVVLIEHIKKDEIAVDVYKLFPVRFYSNTYNISLLGLLIEVQDYNLAIEYCKYIINRNYYEEYNIPYYLKLKEIYTITGDSDELLNIKKILFNISPSYENYLTIASALGTDEEKIAFKNECLAIKLHQNDSKYKGKIDLKFGIWNDDEKYDLILNRVRESYSCIKAFPYLDNLYTYDKKGILAKIIKELHSDYYGYFLKNNRDFLLEFISKNYSILEIENCLSKNRVSYQSRDFFTELFGRYS